MIKLQSWVSKNLTLKIVNGKILISEICLQLKKSLSIMILLSNLLCSKMKGSNKTGNRLVESTKVMKRTKKRLKNKELML